MKNKFMSFFFSIFFMGMSVYAGTDHPSLTIGDNHDEYCDIECSLTPIPSRIANKQDLRTFAQIGKFIPNRSTGTPKTSENWSGYQVFKKSSRAQLYSVDEVSASWIVPEISATSDDTYSSAWVGISGQDKSIQQIGTYQNYVNGEAQYTAWFEMYPNDAFTIDGFPVAPGDEISAKVKWSKDKGNKSFFVLTIANNTTKQRAKFKRSTKKSIALRTEAEWILERPEINGEISTLANYTAMSFFFCRVVMNARKGSIENNKWKHVAISMVNSDGAVISKSSGLGGNGSLFVLKQKNSTE